MQKRRLGKTTLEVSALGPGCRNFVYAYSLPVEKKVALSVLHSTERQGVTFFATAAVYGPFTSEEFVGAAVAPCRDQIVRTTKFGFDLAPNGSRRGLNSRPEHIKKVAEGSLTRLRTDRIALFYPLYVCETVRNQRAHGSLWMSFAASIRRRRGMGWIEQERDGMELSSTPRRSAQE
jgi:aryl-alcohol dehydrogenase-like predicted oxidoreductase